MILCGMVVRCFVVVGVVLLAWLVVTWVVLCLF